jgi:hypothetical protein
MTIETDFETVQEHLRLTGIRKARAALSRIEDSHAALADNAKYWMSRALKGKRQRDALKAAVEKAATDLEEYAEEIAGTDEEGLAVTTADKLHQALRDLEEK